MVSTIASSRIVCRVLAHPFGLRTQEGVGRESSLQAHRGRTYTVAVRSTGPVATSVLGVGSDLDQVSKFGAPIFDSGDIDHLDASSDGYPTFAFQAPSAGAPYVEVRNLLPAAQRYRLKVTTSSAGLPGAPRAALPLPSAPPEAAPAATPAATPTPAACTPFAPANPLAPVAEPWLGVVEGDGPCITIEADGGGYAGELALGAKRFPFRATAAQPGRLVGSLENGGATVPFAADLSGDVVTLADGGGAYVMRRVAPAKPHRPARRRRRVTARVAGTLRPRIGG